MQSPPTEIYGAMHIGPKESSATWIWFINACDKLLTDDFLGKIASISSMNTEASIIATPVVYFTPTGHFSSLSIPKVIEKGLGNYTIFHHHGSLLN